MPEYLPLLELLFLIDKPVGENLILLFADHEEEYGHARGSSANHQAWPGGFWDHTEEVLNIAVAQYQTLNALRPLPFSLSDALIVLAAHDLEKLVRFAADGAENPAFSAKSDKANFRLRLLKKYDIALTPEQANAMLYVEGIRDNEYSNQSRTMGPLAAFAHVCDILSARLWFNHPYSAGDPWSGAARKLPEAADYCLAEEEFDGNGRVKKP